MHGLKCFLPLLDVKNAVTFECGGPHVYSYEDLLRTVAHQAHLKPLLIPVPFAAWHAIAGVAELFPSPPVTRNQVELMQVDNVTSPEMPGFAELAISPRSVEEILQRRSYREDLIEVEVAKAVTDQGLSGR